MKRAIAALLCIALIPLAVQARARSVSLAVGETLTVTCPGLLSGTIGKQQADLACKTLPTPSATPTSTPTATPTGPSAWSFAFDGSPAGPQPWQPSDWANTIHSRDRSSWQTLPTMHAGHGADCAAPPATHDISNYPDAIFLCRDHVMTAIDGSAGYAAIYLQPPVMVDFAQEAVIRWDVSTARAAARDWWDVWVTPFDEQLAAPLPSWLPDLQGPPRNAVAVGMSTTSGQTGFRGAQFVGFVGADIPSFYWVGYEQFLTPSATVRTTFELRLSRTHLWFGIPGVFTWVDADLPTPLDWSQGIIQFGHHSYTPWKDCTAGAPDCGPNTYHWDNLSISRAAPYQIRSLGYTLLDAASPSIALPAGSSGYLRFMGYGDGLELSFDGGQTWQAAERQVQEKADLGHFATYWQSIPANASSVTFRSLASCWCGDWAVRDMVVIAQ
jgi:hypothetical protein